MNTHISICIHWQNCLKNRIWWGGRYLVLVTVDIRYRSHRPASTSRLRRRRGWAYAGQQQQMCGLQSIIGAGRVIRLKLTFNLPASRQLGAQPFITSLTLWCTTPGCGGCRGCAYPVVRLVRYGAAFLVIPTSLVIRHLNWEPKAFSTEGWLWYRTKPTTCIMIELYFENLSFIKLIYLWQIF